MVGAMSDAPTEQIKKFVFTSNYSTQGAPQQEVLEVYIPELLQASYSFYTWPSAPVLAWFLWEHRAELKNKHVLEIGCGTALPGIVAAKCGAYVTLSDSATLPKSLAHTKRSCQVNNLVVDRDVKVIGLTWGLFLSNFDNVGPVDLILGSDCFFEPASFEDILVTVAYLLENNYGAKFICTYQERSSDWSIEHLLAKWDLQCKIRQALKVYVSNIPWTVGHAELRQYFSKYGFVSSATVVFDRQTGLSKNYGFIFFGNEQGFNNALAAEGHKLEGNTLKVQPAEDSD